MDFIELAKKTRNHVDESGVDLLENFVTLHSKTKIPLISNSPYASA